MRYHFLSEYFYDNVLLTSFGEYSTLLLLLLILGRGFSEVEYRLNFSIGITAFRLFSGGEV